MSEAERKELIGKLCRCAVGIEDSPLGRALIDAADALLQQPAVSREAATCAVLNLQPLVHRNDGTRLWQMFEDFETAEQAVSKAISGEGK